MILIEHVSEAADGAEHHEEKDEDEKELEKLEKSEPEMVKICNTIMNQLDEFKVNKHDELSMKNTYS